MINFSISTPTSQYTVEIDESNFENFDRLIDSLVANAKMQLLSHIFHSHPSVYYSSSPPPNTDKLNSITLK